MTIHLKVRSMDFDESAFGGSTEVPEGATAEQAINTFLAAEGKSLTAEKLRESVILVNNTSARPERVLQPEDAIMLLRSLEGG